MIWQLFYPESDTIPCCINVVYTFNATRTNVRSVSVRSRSPPGVQGADRLSVFPKKRLGFCSQLWNSRHSWPSTLLIFYQRVLAWIGLQLIQSPRQTMNVLFDCKISSQLWTRILHLAQDCSFQSAIQSSRSRSHRDGSISTVNSVSTESEQKLFGVTKNFTPHKSPYIDYNTLCVFESHVHSTSAALSNDSQGLSHCTPACSRMLIK